MKLCVCREEEEEALFMRKVEDYNNYTFAPPHTHPSPSLWRQDQEGRMPKVPASINSASSSSSLASFRSAATHLPTPYTPTPYTLQTPYKPYTLHPKP